MVERWQRLDMLVLNAAMLGTLTPVAAIDGKEFNRLLTLNLVAQQALIANFDPLLRRAANGRLLALSTGVARPPRAYCAASAASDRKSAVSGKSVSVRVEPGGRPIIKKQNHIKYNLQRQIKRDTHPNKIAD